MNISETGAVLAKIQAFDNRAVDDAVILAWHEVLEPHAVNDCLRAVTDHFAAETRWIMPAHITTRVKVVEKIRWDKLDSYLLRNTADEYAGITPNAGEVAWAHGKLRRLISTGGMNEHGYLAYKASHLKLDAFMQQGNPLALTPFDNEETRIATKQEAPR